MDRTHPSPIDITIGREHIIIQQRYEAAGAFNDFLITVWFLIGSFFFLYDSLVTDGTWLFIAGSVQLLIKPIVKLAGLIHINKKQKQAYQNTEDAK
ncbi:hypothetical protein HC723_04325 [Vibrio sp. S11_S32]|uniref:YrhK family protein n=1 Tax=Vibrio sp. S11_S32 TaxID=2720225 RepID=UPI001681BF92|nr:YrhK family protein [Vibrio sp. S11_S32]MBD1575678.1 hypothetical protein [Vibrio sp. S11_S32]